MPVRQKTGDDMIRIKQLLLGAVRKFRALAASRPAFAAQKSSIPRARALSLPGLCFFLLTAFSGMNAAAQSNIIYVAPVLVYSGGPYVGFYSPSFGAAFANAQSQVANLDSANWSYLAQNPQSAVAMTLLAAGWAGNPARAADLVLLRRAILARGT